MKNNYLKKAGAVALAAVMAVTFAPVASLNVFAAQQGVEKVDGSNVITADAIITESGTYTVSNGGVTVTISGGATEVTIKPNGQPAVTIKGSDYTNKNSVVTVKGETGDWSKKTGWTYDSVKFGDVRSLGAISLSGNLQIDTTDASFTDKAEKAFGSEPVVLKDKDLTNWNGVGTFYMGDKVIETLAGYDNKSSLWAFNGAVNVKGLTSGKTAKVSKFAMRGTSVSASAADDTSLVKATTKYTYNFTSTTTGYTNKVGTANWTDVQYAAGKNGLTTLDLQQPKTNTDKDIIRDDFLAIRNTNVTAIKYYDRAIELTQNDKDKFNKGLRVGYIDSYDYEENGMTGASAPTGENGMTYFTGDPTAYADDKAGVAVIDGTKYIINDKNTTADANDEYQLGAASRFAASSIKVLRGTSDSGKAVDDLDTVRPQTGVTVSGPETSSIVIGHLTTVGTKYNKTKNVGYVYGANHVEGINGGNFFGDESAALGNQIVSSQIDVPQVAKDTYVIVNDAFADTVANPGKDITYFYDKVATSTNNHADFVFGSVKVVDKALQTVLSGAIDANDNYFTQAKPGDTVFVAKAVKDTFKDVKPMVNVKGELSEESEVQADGRYTWTVNTGTAESIDHVNAYRMYRASGEHVYTINPDEVTMLVNAGWKNEGVAFKVNAVSSKKGTPVYRVYNKNNGGMHFYTANAAERDMLLSNGWTEGAVVFYGAEKATGIPVYRTYNTGSNNGEHNYTTNIAESDMNVKAGWRAEGVAFYVFK